MSRNRYTKLIRKEQRAQLAHHEKELLVLARTLRRPDVESPVVAPENKAKDHRSDRLEQKRLRKLARRSAIAAITQPAHAPVEVAA
jgi:hypothetical protein